MPPVYYHEGRFPPYERLDWPSLIPLVGRANAAVGRYDGTLGATPSPDVLLAPLTTREAVLSSRIEGTQATMGEVLEYEAGGQPASRTRREDIQEVINYRSAMRHAENMLKELPLSLRVIREAHRVLLSGGRGEGKAPGEYRRLPNWIGPPGCTIEQARFVPVGADKLPKSMNEWERNIHVDAPDPLVQLAILHAEFEALHPFLDGNGRIGRMLVPLFMWRAGLIRAPRFYISGFFEARRDAYYESLLAVSRDDNWTGWCRFFLEAVQVQAEENQAKAQAIIDLYDRMKERVRELTRSQYALRALDWIFAYPIFSSPHFVHGAGIPDSTARRFLGLMQEGEILELSSPGRGRRGSILIFPELLNITEDEDMS